MTATKDQKKLLSRCLMNEIPVFVLTGTDQCARAALRAYAEEARRLGCSNEVVSDLETNIIPDFQDYQDEEPETVKLPD